MTPPNDDTFSIDFLRSQLLGLIGWRQAATWLRIIDAMTEVERRDPMVIDNVRLKQLANEAGVFESEVSQFLNQFEVTSVLLGRASGASLDERMEKVSRTHLGEMLRPIVARRRCVSPARLLPQNLFGPRGEEIVFYWSASTARIEMGDHLILRGSIVNHSPGEIPFYDSARPEIFFFHQSQAQWWVPADSLARPVAVAHARLRAWKPYRDQSFTLNLGPLVYWQRHDIPGDTPCLGLPRGRYLIGCEMKFVDHEREQLSTWVVQGTLRSKPIDVEVV